VVTRRAIPTIQAYKKVEVVQSEISTCSQKKNQ
jgi:hypothetical protein